MIGFLIELFPFSGIRKSSAFTEADSHEYSSPCAVGFSDIDESSPDTILSDCECNPVINFLILMGINIMGAC